MLCSSNDSGTRDGGAGCLLGAPTGCPPRHSVEIMVVPG